MTIAGRRLRPLTRLKDRLVALQINSLARERWKEPPLLLVTHPRSGPCPDIQRHALVYWQKDRQWASSREGKALPWLTTRHLALLRAADVVTGVSQEIVDDNAEQGVVAALVPNGVEVEHWTRPAHEPADLAGIPRPRVLFTGSWGWRVDKALFDEVARRRPGLQFVVVGDGAPTTSASNVHFLGKRSYWDLPGYVQHCTLGMIPYVDNMFNNASSPLKLWEYSVGGLPVIASGVRIAESMSGVQSVSGVEGWIEALDTAMACAGRRTAAQGSDASAEVSWEARAQQLLELADTVSPRQPRRSRKWRH